MYDVYWAAAMFSQADREFNLKCVKMLRDAGCAGGFRDTSRIASSNPAMWREIIEFNTPAILTALDNFQKKLDVLRAEIASGDYDAFQREFARGKELRDSWVADKARRS